MPLIVTVKLSRVWIKSETVHDCESSKHNYSSPKPLLFALGCLLLSFDFKICDPVFTRKQQLLSLQKLQKAHKIWSYSPRELPYSVWTILDQFKRRVQFPCGHAWLTIKLALMKETIYYYQQITCPMKNIVVVCTFLGCWSSFVQENGTLLKQRWDINPHFCVW